MQKIKRILRGEEGLGTVEMVLLIAVLIGIAIMFRGVILDFISTILENITDALDGASDVPGQ
ncbi:MAG: hypothetical protein LRZ93_05750 [Clostridiales bacterium]|nr:hypothetical protein [Clostridiales bacterium]